ncbi:MAG: hypothetical protein G5702_03010 [Serratia symbiotica]|nr:hypothetical protein [Serratia symbiotica]
MVPDDEGDSQHLPAMLWRAPVRTRLSRCFCPQPDPQQLFTLTDIDKDEYFPVISVGQKHEYVKMVPEFRTQGMKLDQAIVGCFRGIMPAGRFPTNALRIRQFER